MVTTVAPAVVRNASELARGIGVPLHKLNMWAWKSADRSGQYTEFTIPRRNGEPRKIQAPIRSLGYVQKRIVSSCTAFIGTPFITR